MTIDVLPDDVPLVEIFNQYMNEAENVIDVEAWQTLVHVPVCQKSLKIDDTLFLDLRVA